MAAGERGSPVSQSSQESSFLGRVSAAITRWLAVARKAVFSAGRRYPDPSAVMSTQPEWDREVDGLLADLDEVNRAAWEDASGRPYISANGFAVTQLALTENLLKRIPEETYQRIFAELVEGQQAGETIDQIADRIDRALLFTGSEWWPNRARVIAQTEVHRAWQNGTLAAALYYEPATGPGWTKTWHTELDGRERASHKRADGQTRRLADTFQVGGNNLMYPGDPTGSADEVINCRCDMVIEELT